MEQPVNWKNAYIEKSRMDEAQRLVTGWISTCEVDECGDVMVPQGVDAKYLDSHKSINIDHRREKDYQVASHRWIQKHPDKGVLAQFKMGTHAVANEVWGMIQEQILNCLSIEFWGVDFGLPTHQEMQKYGQDAERIYRKWNLTGYAIVSQPMNAGAVITELKSRPMYDWLDRRVRAGKITVDIAKKLGWDDAAPPRLVLIPNGWVLRATP